MSERLPRYILHGGEQAQLQPYVIAGVEFYGFVLDADRTALETLCDKLLTAPTNGRWTYKPLTSSLICSFYRVKHNNQLDPNLGFMETEEVAFFVPVARVKPGRDIGAIESIGFTLPYIVVNNGWAMASGREAFGVPKEMGEIVLPKGKDDEARLSVSTMAIEKFSPDSEARMSTLATARRTDEPTRGELAKVWSGLKDGFQDAMSLLIGGGELNVPGLGIVGELWDFLVHHEVPLVFLKQFRDIADGNFACYQEVCEAPAKITSFKYGGRLAGDWEVEIGEFDSHPVRSELGLGATNTPRHAWYCEFDFILENGKAV